MSARRQIEVAIDTLVIDAGGARPALDADRLAAAIETEIGRLLAASPLGQGGAASPAAITLARVDAGTLPSPAGAPGSTSLDPAAVGRRVAASVHRVLEGGR